MKGVIVVLSGPSGSGKGTIYKAICEIRSNLKKEISVTTRKPRIDEVDGKDYLFVTKNEFEKMIHDKRFIEFDEYDNEYYGTLKVNQKTLGEKDVFFDKNVKGALKIKEAYPEAILIYVMPPNVNILNSRRGDRGTNRYELSKQEVDIAKKMEWLIINDDVEKAVHRVESILNCVRESSMMNRDNIKFLDDFY